MEKAKRILHYTVWTITTYIILVMIWYMFTAFNGMIGFYFDLVFPLLLFVIVYKAFPLFNPKKP